MRTITMLIACSALTLQAGDWPAWYGPNRDGKSTETGLNWDWKAKEPPVLWEAQIGLGFSAVSISDERVFAFGHFEGQDRVSCFKVSDGSEIWRHEYAADKVAYLHEGGPSATPTVYHGKVYTLSKEGLLHCINAKTGSPIWKKDLVKMAGVKRPDCGFSGSPLGYQDTLIVDSGYLVSVNKDTGELRWRTGKKYDPGYGSPRLFEREGKTWLSMLNNQGLLIADPENGTAIALYPWLTQYKTNATTPVFHEDSFFISTAYNRGCTLVEWNGSKFKPVYENKNMRNQMANSIVHEGLVFGFDRKSSLRRLVQLKCLDYRTGAVKWEQGNLGIGSLIYADGNLIVLSDEGELVLVEASGEAYAELGRKKVLDGKCWTAPVLANGRLYVRNVPGRLVCLDLR